jgi:hypothetical protein
VGARGGVVVKALRYKPAGRGFDSRWCQWNFSVTNSFRSHYGLGVDSASNRNDYYVYFLWVKAAGAYGWQPYHHPVPLSWNLGTLTSWNTLGHSRPVTGLLYVYLTTWRMTLPHVSYAIHLLPADVNKINVFPVGRREYTENDKWANLKGHWKFNLTLITSTLYCDWRVRLDLNSHRSPLLVFE